MFDDLFTVYETKRGFLCLFYRYYFARYCSAQYKLLYTYRRKEKKETRGLENVLEKKLQKENDVYLNPKITSSVRSVWTALHFLPQHPRTNLLRGGEKFPGQTL